VTTTTIHGLSRIYRSNGYPKKIAWTLIILAFISFFFVTLTQSMSDFLAYNVVSQSEALLQNETIFPALTFCSTNMTYNLTSLITKCVFNQAPCNLAADFDQFKESTDKNCLRFNSYKPGNWSLRKTTGIGFSYGMTIQFMMPNLYDGFRVYATGNWINTFDDEFDFYFVSPASIDLYFQRLIYKNLPMPYNQCEVKENTYRQKNCLIQCYQEKAKQKYACSLVSFYLPKEETCFLNNSKMQINDIKTEFSPECKSRCVKECDSVRFSSFIYPLSMSENKTRMNLIEVSGFYSDLTVLEMSQIPKMTLIDLISNVGGTMGLFMGVSCVGLLEVAELGLSLIKAVLLSL